MNILFIYTICNFYSPTLKPLRHHEQMQFGISYISSLLKKGGHNTRLLVLNSLFRDTNRTIIDSLLRSFYPELICFTAVSSEYHAIAEIAAHIKERHADIYLLIGGVHATLNPNEVIKDNFDALCIGEGENPTLEFVTQLNNNILPSKIPNLWIKHGSNIEKNPSRPFLQNLDNLPFPDRDMWYEYIEEDKPWRYSVLLGRGCPFLCTYCCNHALRRTAPGDYVRLRSPANIAQEIKKIAIQSPTLKEIYLEVESIATDQKWAIGLCSELKRLNDMLPYRLSYGANLRINNNHDFKQLFSAFQMSNFKFINIGVESGSERIRREILRRNYSNEDIIETVNMARKHGLRINFFNLIGIPGETLDDFKATVEINRRCLPDWHSTSIFYPYPGTDLYLLCKKRGWLDGKIDTRFERTKAVLNLPEFSKSKIQKSYVWFDYYVYRGVKPIYKILPRILMLKLSSMNLDYLFIRLIKLPLFSLLKNKFKEYIYTGSSEEK